MLIKVWVYGFCNKIYTSRPLARKIREDLCFIWLAGAQEPSFKTLSEFRGSRMQGMVEEIFKEVLLYLLEKEYIDLELAFSKPGGEIRASKLPYSDEL